MTLGGLRELRGSCAFVLEGILGVLREMEFPTRVLAVTRRASEGAKIGEVIFEAYFWSHGQSSALVQQTHEANSYHGFLS